MDATKKFGMVELRCLNVGDLDALMIFSSDSNVYEWISTEIEKNFPFKKKEMLHTRLYLDFQKQKGGWRGTGYVCVMATDDAILLLLNNGWEPFNFDRSENISTYLFKKEIY